MNMSPTTNEEVTWMCRFHPIHWMHEVGCPHKIWTNQQLIDAIIAKKKFEASSKYPQDKTFVYDKTPGT